MTNDLNEMNCTRASRGPANAVCLFAEFTGIGDDIHAAPVVYQMVKDGYDVTVYCRGPHYPYGSRFPLWESVGAKPLEADPNVLNMAFDANEGHKYGRLINLYQWGTWEEIALGYMKRDRIKQFADIVGHRVPDNFRWFDVYQHLIGPNTHGDYILYAPHSVEAWRSVPDEEASVLYDRLSELSNVVWLTDDSKPTPRREVKTRAADIAELLTLVYHAKYVVSVDNGVANIAGAFAKPLTALAGMTDPTFILGAYQRFNRDWRYTVVRGAQPNGCSMPCYRHPARGFFGLSESGLRVAGGVHGSKCLGQYEYGMCMKRISIDHILSIIQNFISTTIDYGYRRSELCEYHDPALGGD